MGLSTHTISLNLDLCKNGLYKEVKHVVDMGSQELHITFDAFQSLMELYSVTTFRPEEFEALKNYPACAVSTEKFYRLLGVETYTCLDLGSDHNALRVDLNQPLENKDLFNKFDLVTDYGNNEHPFNVAEAFRTMHRLCKPQGLMIIDQAVFNGNGYYNFDIGFFEGVAAANGYEIIYGGYNVRVNELPYMMVNLPLMPELIKKFDWTKLPYLGITYIFRKKSDQDFVFPYQSRCHIEKFAGSYLSSKIVGNMLPLRSYLPVHLQDFTFAELKKELLSRIKKRIKFF